MLKVYNSFGHKLEEFKTLEPGKVKIYVCGPTVYSHLHVGNFRGPVFFNFVRNWLEYLGYKVDYATNFTDVDDKIIKRAEVEKVSAQEISEKYIVEYQKDFNALGLRPANHNPKVTECMPQIIEFIQKLIEKDVAYTADGDVNFAINKFPVYGHLSGRKIEDLLEGVRIDISDKKQNPLDFALWKSAKPGEDLRGSAWPSPWGQGRPGWHIECSVMAHNLFGNQIDIHGGGLDLLFPHHENEIAQSESCTHQQYARYWLHWNLLNFGGSKMSKSLGNIVNMKDFLKDHHPEVYKWMMLSVHYRSVGDFTQNTIDQSVAGLARVYSALSLAESLAEHTSGVADAKAWTSIEDALNNDFGTPAAFAVIFEQIRKFNSTHRRGMKSNDTIKENAANFIAFIKKFGNLMALFQEVPSDFLIQLDDLLLAQKNLKRAVIDDMVQKRSLARTQKDFSESDRLRKALTDMGISVSDLPEGSFWEVTK